jgi:hypothetical protein
LGELDAAIAGKIERAQIVAVLRERKRAAAM